MTLPNFQAFMDPILETASDGLPHNQAEFEQGSVRLLNLSADDRTQMLPGGSMTVIRDRSGWALYYIFRAGLLERTSRGYYAITARGRESRSERTSGMDQNFLRRFPEFVEFQAGKAREEHTGFADAQVAEEGSQTPKETIAAAYARLEQKLATDLLDQIYSRPPRFFERLVIELLRKMGYGLSERNVHVVGRSGDGGIDDKISQDALGLDCIYVQAKRWKDKVGTPEVRDFVGSLAGGAVHKGVFITTSGFQPSVREYLRGVQQRVELIDGQRLAELYIEHGVGVVVEKTYALKRVDLSLIEQD